MTERTGGVVQADRKEVAEANLAAAAENVDVFLATMPFGPLRQPSIGLSLLQAGIERDTSAAVRSRYFTIDFAEQLGAQLYIDISEGLPGQEAQFGEWLFRPALFQGPRAARPDQVQSYQDQYLTAAFAPEVLADLLAVRGRTADFVDRCAEEVAQARPKVIGLTSVFQQHVATLALARKLKELLPDSLVVLGGANCEGAMGRQTASSFPFVDCVVSGDGEVPFGEIVSRVLAGRSDFSDLAGVTHLAAPAGPTKLPMALEVEMDTVALEHMDSLPIPNYDDFFAQWNASALADEVRPRILFETSRGCWWGAKQHCTFCGLNGLSMAFRSKSSDRCLEELSYLIDRHGEHTVIAVDNILDMRYFRDFIPALAEGSWPKLCYEVKANLDKPKLRMLAEAGIVEVLPGVESFSDDVLNLMRKGVTGLQNIQLLKWCKELGIWPNWFLLWGFPNEDPAEYEWMGEVLPMLEHLPPPGAVTQIRLDRFSPNFETSAELGFTNVRPFAAYRQVYPLAERELRELAYYFEYDYADGRDASVYGRQLERQVASWQSAFDQSELALIDRGASCWVVDSRPSQGVQMHVLTGIEGELYRACDAVRREAGLEREFAGRLSAAAIDELLSSFEAKKLVVRRRGSVIALAVRAQEGDATLVPQANDEVTAAAQLPG